MNPKSLSIRKLEKKDFEKILQINASHQKNMGYTKPKDYDRSFALYIDSYLNSENRYIVGAFEQETLVSYLGIVTWTKMPFWSFTSVKAVAFWNSKKFRPQSNGIATLAEHVIKQELNNGRVGYWYLTSMKRNRSHATYWRENIPGLDVFYFISRKIEKGYRPQHEVPWHLMGQQTWPFDLILRMGIKKDSVHHLAPFCKMLDINPDFSNIQFEDTAKVLQC